MSFEEILMTMTMTKTTPGESHVFRPIGSSSPGSSVPSSATSNDEDNFLWSCIVFLNPIFRWHGWHLMDLGLKFFARFCNGSRTKRITKELQLSSCVGSVAFREFRVSLLISMDELRGDSDDDDDDENDARMSFEEIPTTHLRRLGKRRPSFLFLHLPPFSPRHGMLKNEALNSPKTMPLQYQGTPLLRSNCQLLPPQAESHRQGQMLSFSNTKSESFLSKDGDFAYYQRNPTPIPSPYPRNAGSTGYGSLNLSMHGTFTGARGPFTPSQWIELEHQALIYKYMTSNVPVPSNLLIPIKKSLYPYGLSSPSNPTSTWGTYHLGFSGNNDPEPGRCRRTDGKKWCCSRDAVADQKYCERHINRGRHRSRKPVEGQPGQAVSGTGNSKRVPMNSSMSTSVMPSSGASSSLTTAQKQFKSLQPAVAANPSADAFVNKMQGQQGVSVMSAPTLKPKSNNSTYNIGKQEFLVEAASQPEFGLVSTDSLLNPSLHDPLLLKRSSSSFHCTENRTTEFATGLPLGADATHLSPPPNPASIDRSENVGGDRRRIERRRSGNGSTRRTDRSDTQPPN